MGQGRLCQSICLHVLLIAAAIQGATPDAQDLASIKPLWLICRVLVQPDTLSEDDELPDEVCEPMSAEMDAITRHQAGSAEAVILETLLTDRLTGACQHGAAGSAADGRSTHLSDGLIYTLCRLLC
jgi:hypothetical protein